MLLGAPGACLRLCVDKTTTMIGYHRCVSLSSGKCKKVSGWYQKSESRLPIEPTRWGFEEGGEGALACPRYQLPTAVPIYDSALNQTHLTFLMAEARKAGADPFQETIPPFARRQQRGLFLRRCPSCSRLQRTQPDIRGICWVPRRSSWRCGGEKRVMAVSRLRHAISSSSRAV